MKKVLHLLASNSFSGAENVVATIISGLGNEYEMVYCSPDGEIRNALEERNIKYYPLKKISIKEVKKVIKQYKPDIIHAHDFKASFLSTLVSKRIPIISHIHGNNAIMNKCNIYTIMYMAVSKKFKKIIWVTDSAYKDFYFKEKIKKNSIILYNIINEEEVYNKSNLFSTEETYDLIFLGRIAEPKNPERLIRVFKLIASKNANIKMAIVGDGELRDNIEKLIDEYGLQENITMYGFRSNPYPILRNSKMLIMVSRFEGTPMCALEALSLGIPVISTPVDGLKKIIVNGENGYLYEDDKGLADCILKLVENKNKLEMLSKGAYETFSKINDTKKYFEIIRNVYE